MERTGYILDPDYYMIDVGAQIVYLPQRTIRNGLTLPAISTTL
jgi:hypothetical protein